jgi:hypothetical protein
VKESAGPANIVVDHDEVRLFSLLAMQVDSHDEAKKLLSMKSI